ncbi:MAG: hypothetical protein LKI24_11515 [Acidipropionibacterium sp.]|nr:hypothetical protein [Acidipropionibacterium sp.]
MVGASGTGTQEVMTQVDRLGAGISHAIGLGGRDLSEAVGGRTASQALAALDADPDTDVIVLVSKPPAPAVRARIDEQAQQLSKPVVTMFVDGPRDAGRHGNVTATTTLADAAARAVELVGVSSFNGAGGKDAGLVGLYTGGTLADEAAVIVRDDLGLDAALGAGDPGVVLAAGQHRIIDLGDDVYTQGRPHPMIDPALRAEKIAEALADPDHRRAAARRRHRPRIGRRPRRAPSPGRSATGWPGPRPRAARCASSPRSAAPRETSRIWPPRPPALTEAGVRVLSSNCRRGPDTPPPWPAGSAPRRPPPPRPRPARIADLLAGPQGGQCGPRPDSPRSWPPLDVPVVQWTWAPPAGGDARLARIVERLLAR